MSSVEYVFGFDDIKGVDIFDIVVSIFELYFCDVPDEVILFLSGLSSNVRLVISIGILSPLDLDDVGVETVA